MIVKLIAPGIIPGDHVTADLPAVPQIGHTVLIETPDGNGGHDEELLTVKSVIWSVEIVPGRGSYATTGADGGLPEVVCERTEDASLATEVYPATVRHVVARCADCGEPLYRDRDGELTSENPCTHYPAPERN